MRLTKSLRALTFCLCVGIPTGAVFAQIPLVSIFRYLSIFKEQTPTIENAIKDLDLALAMKPGENSKIHIELAKAKLQRLARLDQELSQKRASLAEDLEKISGERVSLEQKTSKLEAEKNALILEKQDLETKSKVLQNEKTSLLKDKADLELREKILGAGLVASITTLLVALFGGLAKLPMLRVEKKLKQLELQERQMKFEELIAQRARELKTN